MFTPAGGIAGMPMAAVLAVEEHGSVDLVRDAAHEVRRAKPRVTITQLATALTRRHSPSTVIPEVI
jgi:hypothetical protein